MNLNICLRTILFVFALQIAIQSTVGMEIATKYLMKTVQHEFTDYRGFRLFISTFNVNAKCAKEESLSDLWLSVDSEPPDLYVIGIQEVDLSKNILSVG